MTLAEHNLCRLCVMDKSAKEITFDEFDNGICNFCYQAQKALKEIELEKPNLNKWIQKIKQDGRNNKYDCLLGLSGGADSSTTLHYAVQLGLRPLTFSIDNGWQSDIAQENIMRMVEGLKVPFYRYTVDLERFRELQMAFIKAGVPNIEIPTDHILMASSLEMAKKYGIRWILSGGNVVTESIMPESWGYQPRDLIHIKSIYKWATGKNLKGLPLCGLLKWNWYKWVNGIKTLYLLDYLDYNKEEAIKLLQENYGYKSYGDKHCENVFTSWHINYYLFEKFGFDKRKAHFSSLINSNQMTREEALLELQKCPVYPKLGLEEQVMKYPKRKHEDFKMDKWFERISKFIRLWRYIIRFRQA